MFYLVMPTEQGESVTDDLNDPPTPTASHFPQPLEEVMPVPQTQPEEETHDQSEAMQQEEEEEAGQSQAGHQSHVIKNVDEIFHTIEGLASKLRQLKVSLGKGGCLTRFCATSRGEGKLEYTSDSTSLSPYVEGSKVESFVYFFV